MTAKIIPPLALCVAIGLFAHGAHAESTPAPLRVGIIGLDTSHAIAFTTTLNKGPKKPEDAPKVAGARVVAAYPQGSRDIESSTKRVPDYTKKVEEMGVEIVDSVEALVSRVDAVLLESNDGKVHLEQLQPILKAKKPVFIDKPIAASLTDAVRIFDAAKKAGVPVMSASSLRYGATTQEVRAGSLGKVTSAEAFSPVNLEPSHPDLFWYGIHGCESLYTVMGTGCVSVKRSEIEDGRVEVTGTWKDGRIGVFRQENGKDRRGYGGSVKGEKGEAKIGAYDGYDVLLFKIIEMFRSGQSPIAAEETLELYAFMEAADESKRRGGAAVKIEEVLTKARAAAGTQP
jgi:predicted dehydrogenase